MDANSFGSLFRITTWGESHGPGMGVVVEGCPAGVPFDEELLARELDRRRPGSSGLVSPRREPDRPRVLSGVFQGETLGTPIAVVIENRDARPEDYDRIAREPRRGHADDLWREKFGRADPRGGGRSSGRETVARVAGGAVARMAATAVCPGMRVTAFVSRIGPLALTDEEHRAAVDLDTAAIDAFPGRFPAPGREGEVEELLQRARAEGHSYGGVGRVIARGVPRGLGAPVFHKLKADLAAAWMGIGAATGVELGAGFAAAAAEGAAFHAPAAGEGGYGGIRGGIATGEPITARVAFKPPATLLDQARKGRHDPTVIVRALPVLEAMTWLVLTDHLLQARTDRVP